MRTQRLGMALIAAVVMALPLAAQPGRGQGDRAPRTRGDDAPTMVPGGRRAMAPAAALLRQRQQLVLTDEQVTKLEALAASQQQALTRNPGQQLRLQADLMDAMAGTANPTAVRAALDKISAERNGRVVAGLQARNEALAVLTPAQRTRAEAQRAGGRAGRTNARAGGRRGDVRGNVRGTSR